MKIIFLAFIFVLVIGWLSPVGFSTQENLDNELVIGPSILPGDYGGAASVYQAGSESTTVKIYPIADAFVDSQDNPNGNYGGQTWIAINQAGGSRPESTWLKFDLSSIPSSATVTDAVFRAYAYQIWWNDKRSAALWDVTTNAWSESTITANNAPWSNRGSKISSDILGSVPGWWEWNITSWVDNYKGVTRSAWLSNAWSVGGSHRGQYYYSKEYSDVGYRPYLEVTYVAENMTVKLSPIADAFTDLRDNPSGNYGSENWIGVNRATNPGEWPSGLGEGTFIKFDLSGIPANATVTSVTFGAYAYQIWYSTTCDAALRQFGTDWNENTITGDNAPWETLGSVVGSTVTGSIPGWWMHSVDVSYVQGKLGGQIGFYYCYPGTASGMHYGQYYRSREYVDSNYRPYLEVTYTISGENEFRCKFNTGNPFGRDNVYDNSLNTTHFIIHYNRTGPNAVPSTDANNNGIPDYVDKIADAAEYSWATESSFGFPSPPDPLIDIYVWNTGFGKTYDKEDNDLIYEPGENLAIDIESDVSDRITGHVTVENLISLIIAHEFFHCVQANYSWRENSWLPEQDSNAWIDEGTAVWMEDEVFDNVNAYVVPGQLYRESALDNPDNTLTHKVRRYESWLYWKFLSEHPRYGGAVGRRIVIRRVFEAITATRRGSAAVDSALKSISPYYSFKQSFKEWTIANWLNGLHNHNGNLSDDAYEEGDNYNDVSLRFEINYDGTRRDREDNVYPWAADYVEITPVTNNPLRINFDGGNASYFMVRVILIKNNQVYGMNELDLDAAQDGDYWIYQADNYDKIVLVIARGEDVGAGDYTFHLIPEYGDWKLPFKFSDAIDNGDNPSNMPYHIELRISTNPPQNSGSTSIKSQTKGAIIEKWVEAGRGRDYMLYRNSLTGEYKQQIYPGPIYTWDGSRWVSYSLELGDNYYQVQHPIASARFYSGYTEFWDENFSERKVASEDWSIEHLDNGSWYEMDFTSATISYEAVSEDEIQFVRTASSSYGVLRTTYIFRRGSPLKIMPKFTASEDVVVRFAWRSSGISSSGQRVGRAKLIDLNPMKCIGASENLMALGKLERNVSVSFINHFSRPLATFAWWEEAENENLLIEVDATRENFLIHFGDFRINASQAVILDPTVQIGPSDDTWLDNRYPSDIHGDDPWIQVGMWPGVYEQRIFLKFSLNSLPVVTLTSSHLLLCVIGIEQGVNGKVDARKVTDDSWDEWITWGEQPAYGAVLSTTYVTGGRDEYFSWDVLSFVQSELNGDKTASFCMKENGQVLAYFYSTEASGNKPYLEVIYKSNTSLAVSPSSFQLRSGESTAFTATLTSGGSPLSGKIITWSDNAGGTFNPPSGTTNSSGQVLTTYTAPIVNAPTAVTITATFAGDASYNGSSGSSTGTITLPVVQSAIVYWRYDNSTIDASHYDGSMGMQGPAGTTSGVWSANISAPGSGKVGKTIYWRVRATASDERDNWSIVYVGGKIMP